MEILLVDDHTLFRNGLKMLLDTLPGYEVTGEASNGKEFLELITQHDYDIVFLDIEMPYLNGFDLLAKFDPLFFDVIFTTAYDS